MIIRMESIGKIYDTGKVQVEALKDVSLCIDRENSSPSWDLQARENRPHEHTGVPGQSYERIL